VKRSCRDRGNPLAAICDNGVAVDSTGNNIDVPRAVLCRGAITMIGLKQETLVD